MMLERIVILVTPTERDAIKKTAGLVPLSTWIRVVVMRKVERDAKKK